MRTTEMQIGNTLFILTSECSEKATETLEQKLERIICRHASDMKNIPKNGLAMCENLREYGLATNL